MARGGLAFRWSYLSITLTISPLYLYTYRWRDAAMLVAMFPATMDIGSPMISVLSVKGTMSSTPVLPAVLHVTRATEGCPWMTGISTDAGVVKEA